jgi:CRISPR-associated protein Cst2
MENVKGILVSTLVPMENQMANGGEKLLGNASSIKRRPDGRAYLSGQMQRHSLFSAIARINLAENNPGDTYVSNGDGIGDAIEVDLRADLGGFMHPSKGSYAGRRTSPLTVTPAVAMSPSEVGRDLLVRFKMNQAGDKDQALATKEFSERDIMLMNFFLDITTLSITKRFEYNGEYHVQTNFVKHVTEIERKRRVKLFLEATMSLTDYANQARNAVTGEPQQVLIVFDDKLSRKASRYFQANEIEKKNLIAELESRKAKILLGDDTNGTVSVHQAYTQAFAYLETATLYDPCGGDNAILPYARVFENS